MPPPRNASSCSRAPSSPGVHSGSKPSAQFGFDGSKAQSVSRSPILFVFASNTAGRPSGGKSIALGADHVSWYELEVKPESSLARQGATVDEEFSEEAYRLVVERLEEVGYHWYETANFARPGHECRHSLAYWQAADYVGVGIGAVSTVGADRWRNAPDLPGYISRAGNGEVPRRTGEALDSATRRRERWMLGLRLARPFRMDVAGPPDHPDALQQLADLGLLSYDADELRLSRDGRFVQNAILCELMEYPT